MFRPIEHRTWLNNGKWDIIPRRILQNWPEYYLTGSTQKTWRLWHWHLRMFDIWWCELHAAFLLLNHPNQYVWPRNMYIQTVEFQRASPKVGIVPKIPRNRSTYIVGVYSGLLPTCTVPYVIIWYAWLFLYVLWCCMDFPGQLYIFVYFLSDPSWSITQVHLVSNSQQLSKPGDSWPKSCSAQETSTLGSQRGEPTFKWKSHLKTCFDRYCHLGKLFGDTKQYQTFEDPTNKLSQVHTVICYS